jgi:hypothetical protein
MASFTRRGATNPAPKNNRTKLLLVGVLVVALAALLVTNLHLFGPRNVEAGAGGASILVAEPAAPDETSAQALANLSADPTAQLLTDHGNSLGALDSAPKDPFRLDPTWLASLRTSNPQDPTPRVSPAAPQPLTPLYNPDQLKVQAIFKDPQRTYAVVNGNRMTSGAIIAGCQIVRIEANSVWFQPLHQPASAQFEISIKPVIKQPATP